MRQPLATLLAAFAMTAAPATALAQAAPASDGTLLSVSSRAEARKAPDIATFSAGVVTQAADGNAALRQNAEQMNRVLAAIKAAGVADKDVQTSGISLNPQYRYEENQPPRITGY